MRNLEETLMIGQWKYSM